MPGALAGLRIIELAGIGPAPFCGMMLADHGADVIRVERPGGAQAGVEQDFERNILCRSRRSIILDLKEPEDVDILHELVATADGLIEGFRPGVMERLGLGPEALLARNPGLVYGRMTGWGQKGPLSSAAGHDINYIALAGNLHGYGRAGQKPTPPANAVGDFGGGGMMLAFAMLAGILHVRQGGSGQVIDCAMVDGAAILASMTWSLFGSGNWEDARGVNIVDSGAPYYDTYETSDGHHVAIGAVEPHFFEELLTRCDSALAGSVTEPLDRSMWPAMREHLEALFLSRTRDEWCKLLEGTNACFSPVLSMNEAPHHPHNSERGTFVEAGGILQPRPAPSFSRTPAAVPTMPKPPDHDRGNILAELGR